MFPRDYSGFLVASDSLPKVFTTGARTCSQKILAGMANRTVNEDDFAKRYRLLCQTGDSKEQKGCNSAKGNANRFSLWLCANSGIKLQLSSGFSPFDKRSDAEIEQWTEKRNAACKHAALDCLFSCWVAVAYLTSSLIFCKK